jgi:hypothetical protein
MAALYREAAALALATETGGGFDVARLARLAQLAQLAQGTLARFQAFTGDLHKLVGDLAALPRAPAARVNVAGARRYSEG